MAFVEEFHLGYDPETMCAEEIDRWIERLGPIRLELRATDDRLRKNQTESNQLSV